MLHDSADMGYQGVQNQRQKKQQLPGAGGQGVEEVGSYLKGTVIQFHKMKKVLEMDGGDSCTI